MDLGISERVKPLRNDILEFIEEHIVPLGQEMSRIPCSLCIRMRNQKPIGP